MHSVPLLDCAGRPRSPATLLDRASCTTIAHPPVGSRFACSGPVCRNPPH